MAERRGPSVRQVTEELVLVELAGRRVLAQAECPHRKGRLLFAHLDEGTLRIRCPLHHSTFDLGTGERTAGPACDPLRVVAVVPDGSDGTREAAAFAAAAVCNATVSNTAVSNTAVSNAAISTAAFAAEAER